MNRWSGRAGRLPRGTIGRSPMDQARTPGAFPSSSLESGQVPKSSKTGVGVGATVGSVRRPSLSARTIAEVMTLAGGRCSYATCREKLVGYTSEGILDLADIAHIVASSPEGPRGGEGSPGFDRSDPSNLMLLCPTHHRLVDRNPGGFDVADLRAMKAKHEMWIQETITRGMLRVTLVELEEVVSMLLAPPSSEALDFTVVPPAEKMSKNGLSRWSREALSAGIPRAREVGRLLGTKSQIDPDFPDRLKAGFVLKYRELRAAGIRGDELFRGMQRFAASDSSDFSRMAAGLAVLSYLFESCEVFES